MRRFDKSKFIKFIIDNNVIILSDQGFKLKSGRTSPYYINWRVVTNDVYLIDELTNFILDFIHDLDLNFDCIFGVPEGTTKIAIITQYKWAKSREDYKLRRYTLPMGRGRVKDYGDPRDKYFIGEPKGNVIILEDVVTTGNSLLSAIEMCRNVGTNVIATIILTDRLELRDDGKHVKDVIENSGIKYYSMSTIIDILKVLIKEELINNETKRKVIEYLKTYSILKDKVLEEIEV